MRTLRTITFALVAVIALCGSAAGISNGAFRTKPAEVTVIQSHGSAHNARASQATSSDAQGAVRADHRGWHQAPIKSRPGSKRHHAVRHHGGSKLVRGESGDDTQAANTTGTAQPIQAQHTQSTESDDDSADHHGTANDDDNGTDDTESADNDGDSGTGDDVEGDDNSDCAGGSGDDVEGDHQSDCDDDQGDSDNGDGGGDGD